MRLWLPLLVLALALGIFAADVLAFAPRVALALAAPGAALAICARRRPRLRFAAALCIAFAAGALSLALRLAAESPAGGAATSVVVEARIAERARLPGGQMRLVLRGLREISTSPGSAASAVAAGRGAKAAGLRARESAGPRRPAERGVESSAVRLPRAVQLYAPAAAQGAEGIGAVAVGARVRAALVLQAAPGLRNPGGRNLRRGLARRGIGGRARLQHPRLYAVVAPPRCVPCAALASRRLIAAQRLESAGRGGALLAALALGARSGLPRPLRDAAGATGLAHLLAVSGLHLAMVAGAAFAAARLLLARAPGASRDARRLALIAALAASLAYGWLAGFGVPMRRALVFLAAWVAASAARRPVGDLSRLSLAAGAVLVWDPAALFSPGAQLSFTAVAGLMLGRRPAGNFDGDSAAGGWLRGGDSSTSDGDSVIVDGDSSPAAPPAQSALLHNRVAAAVAAARDALLRSRIAAAAASALDLLSHSRIADACIVLLRSSAGAVAVTAPLAALYFGAASPFGWLANLLAVPFTALLLLPLALCAAALALVAPTGAAAALLIPAAAQVGEFAAASLMAWAGRAPVIAPGAVPAPWLVFATALLAPFVLRARRTRWRLLGALAISLAVALGPPAPLAPPVPRAVFLDVGHGDAVLVQGRRAAVLVDAGASAPRGSDRGATRVLPALRALGVRRLDVAVLSHGDLDHRGGLPSVLRGVPTDALWLPPGGRGDAALSELRAVARARGTQIVERGAESPPQQVGDLLLRPLWPPRGFPAPANERSLVLEISLAGGAGRKLLLTGDIGARTERALLARHAPGALRAELLKLAHHGSRTSSSAAFLSAVAPRLAIVSAPHRSRFGMPHFEVTGSLNARRIPWLWTGRDGAVLAPLQGPLCARRFAAQSLAQKDAAQIPHCAGGE